MSYVIPFSGDHHGELGNRNLDRRVNPLGSRLAAMHPMQST